MVRWEVEAGFDAAAPGYARPDTFLPFFRQIASTLVGRAGISAGDQVLELGCGTGLGTVLAARAAGPAGRLTGIDLSAGMLARARSACADAGLTNVTLIRADATAPPGPVGQADVVLSSMMIFLLPDPARAVRAWWRLLRPGGTLAFSWNAGEDPRWVPVIAAVDAHVPAPAAGFDTLLHHPPFDDPGAVDAMLARAGYTGVSTTLDRVESRYDSVDRWWTDSWHGAPRVSWQRIPPDDRDNARDDALRALEPLRSAGGPLSRRSLIGWTVARRPA